MNTGKVRFVYRHYAFLGPESVWASEAAECADEQGRFWEYHDALFDNWSGTNAGGYAFNNLLRFARQVGLDTQQFSECMDERRYVERVHSDSNFAQDKGVASTPTVFINGEHVRGNDYETFRQAIEAALAEAE